MSGAHTDGVGEMTPEANLLEALTGYVKKRQPACVAVSGYREHSFNIGYCATCSEIVTEVDITWVDRHGAPKTYDYCGDLGELIRELTDSPAQRDRLEAVAVRESEDDRWDAGAP